MKLGEALFESGEYFGARFIYEIALDCLKTVGEGVGWGEEIETLVNERMRGLENKYLQVGNEKKEKGKEKEKERAREEKKEMETLAVPSPFGRMRAWSFASMQSNTNSNTNSTILSLTPSLGGVYSNGERRDTFASEIMSPTRNDTLTTKSVSMTTGPALSSLGSPTSGN